MSPGKAGSLWRRELIAFFVVLFAVDWYLYFRHAGHFFQADSIFLLNNRAHSISEFLREFIQLNPSGWYRPLANETITSILFPILGLNPIGYRIPVYVLFLAISLAVYALAFAVSRRQIVAMIATFYFSIHTTNAYTTFDIGFIPELLYTLFYIGAALAYLQYIRQGTKWAQRLSIVCFMASLLSKEAAVTLPGTLIALHLIFGADSESFSTRFVQAFRSTIWHTLVLVAYLTFALGYLHVMGIDFTKSFERPDRTESGVYYYVVDRTLLENAEFATRWVFNMPAGYFGQWQKPTQMMQFVLENFRLVMLALTIGLIFRPGRKVVLIGVAWFVITVLPALPLLNHFIPYYLFLPLVGFSLVVGAAFTWAYDLLRPLQPMVAATAVILVFAGMLYVCGNSIEHDIRENRLLGGSARLAASSLSDLKRLYPTLPAKATLYIDDTEEPIAWEHSSGGLIRMAYNTRDLSVFYASEGSPVFGANVEGDPFLLFRMDKHQLVDESAAFRANPLRYYGLHESDVYKLTLSKSEVVVGDKYSLSIIGAANSIVRVAYTVDDGPFQTFSAKLDSSGSVSFDVSPETTKGSYRLLGFNVAGQREWISSNAMVKVH